MDWYFREFATFSSQPETHLQLNNAVIARSGAVQLKYNRPAPQRLDVCGNVRSPRECDAKRINNSWNDCFRVLIEKRSSVHYGIGV